MKKNFTVLILLLVSFTMAIAQTRVVTGKVTSAEDGEGLPGVNILVQGTTKGTTTDVEGNYLLELQPTENTLVFSFVGYETITRDITGQNVVDIVLATEAASLEEIVVIGYGTVRKSDLTGAVSSVRGADLTKIPNVSPIQALQGKVSGVQITSNSGAPGAGTIVRIRGTSTFNDASPIFVVDGVILDNIDFLNPADIESMEVLKDASSTAIYGSRGANGVILITTKKGVQGQTAPVINFSAEYSIQKLQKKIDLLSGPEFAQVVNDITPGTYNNVNAVPNTDWQDLIFQTAPIQNYQFSASGSTERAQYYAGIGYFRQDGIIAKSDYERLTIKFNNTFHLSKAVRLGTNLGFTPYKQQNTNAFAPYTAYRAQPVIAPFQSDGSYSAVPGVGNVLASIEYTNNLDKAIRSVNNVYGEVDFLKGFTFKSSFGLDGEYKRNSSFTPAFEVSPQQFNVTSDLEKVYTTRLSWLWENTLTYIKEIDKHSVNAVVGYTMQEASSEYLRVSAENILREEEDFWYFNRDNLRDEDAVENRVEPGQNFSMISYLARVNYTYNNRYLFTFTYRRDGSSKFNPANRYADFPSFALGWNVINETFLQDVTFLSNLKLRGSWGILGNDKIDYSKQYSPVVNGFGAVFGTNATLYPGSSFQGSGNVGILWEETHQTDLGLEFGLFNDRLTGELDYYNRNTKDILITLRVPGYYGLGPGQTVTYNIADVTNRGIEYTIAWKDEIEDFRYRIGTLGTTIHNEVNTVYGTGEEGDRRFNETFTTATSPGLPLGAFYGYQVEGIFQNQAELDAYPHRAEAGVGDLRFVDVTKDNMLTGDDRTYLGSPIPTFLYGLNLEIGFKGFDLSADFQGQSGNKIYNAKETVRPDLYNFEQHVFNRWRGEGTSATEPRATAGGYNFLPSSRFIQDGSFFRLRSVTLGYNLPSSLTGRMKMRSARFYLRGTNVFTITNYTGYSPEVSGHAPAVTPTGNLDYGIDNGVYPVTTIYSVGLNVTF